MEKSIKERPILFNGPMVRALLDGSKTETRRVVKSTPDRNLGKRCMLLPHELAGEVNQGKYENCPYGQPGDRLWVRESHWWFKDEPDHESGYFPPMLTIEDVEYRADGDDGRKVWRPSIHMPRWASRITLEIVSVRVERLQDISHADAMAEGMAWDDAVFDYRTLWESINGAGSWDANPLVWVVEFKKVTP